EVMEANVSVIDSREKQILEDLDTLAAHSIYLQEQTELNVGTEIAMMQMASQLQEEQAAAYEDYQNLCQGIMEQVQAGMELVDQNKHFTGPSKRLSEAPAQLKERNRAYERLLLEITKDNFEEKSVALMHEVMDSYEEIQELEKTIQQLLAMLKESNMAATKLVMKFQGNERMIQAARVRNFAEDMAEFRDDIVGLRNVDEEVSKVSERIAIQVQDVREELASMKNELAELESDIIYLKGIVEEDVL
ncbi:MAG: hypothetical protein J6R94_06480, partial [Agathobacter sp.]|nr:hypothetical protein [Agathobacter sp.]